MPAPRAVLHEIDELGLSHDVPWTEASLREQRTLLPWREGGWVLVAKGKSVIKRDGRIVNTKRDVEEEDDDPLDDRKAAMTLPTEKTPAP